MPHYRAVAFLLFIVGFVIRLYFVVTMDDVTYGTDSAARFMQARDWYLHPEGIPGGLIWLPLFHLLLVSFVPLGLSFASSASLVVLGLSSLSVPAFYVVIRKSFNAPVAFWSALLLAINPFHIMYSSWYMTENVFLFFVIAAFYFLLRFLEGEKKLHLILSSLFVNAACMIRYEGWTVAVLLPVFLFLKRNDLAICMRYFLFNIVSVILYCIASYSINGVWVYGVFMSQREVEIFKALTPDLFEYLKSQLSAEWVYPSWLYFLVIGGIAFALFKKYRLAYLFIWLLLFTFSAYGILTFTSQPFSRYLSCSLLMLLPFGALVINEISKNNRLVFVLALVLIIFFSVPVIEKYYHERMEYSMAPSEYKNACKILKATRQGNEKVIFQIWIRGIDFGSFLQDADIDKRLVYYPPYISMSIFNDYQKFSEKKLEELISDTSYHYIFIQRDMELDYALNSSRVNQFIVMENIYFDTLYNRGDYYLLQIERKK